VVVIADGADMMLGEVLALVVYVLIAVAYLLCWLPSHRNPITRPVGAWLEVAALLARHGDGALATAIQGATGGRRLGDNVIIALTADEQRRVTAVPSGGRSE
jgi:hypothetical protein